MSWTIRFDTHQFDSDDFLIDDIGEIEKTTGQPWSLANPLRNLPTARAFLAAAMLRTGIGPEDVELRLKTLTLRQLRKAFTYTPDDDTVEDREAAAPLDLTSPGSSRGERPTDGPQPSPEPSE